MALADFEQVSSDDQDGFTYEEFVRIGGKYSEVMAFPVLSVGGAMLGVISVDVAARAGVASCVLDTELEGVVAATSALLAEDIDMLDELE